MAKSTRLPKTALSKIYNDYLSFYDKATGWLAGWVYRQPKDIDQKDIPWFLKMFKSRAVMECDHLLLDISVKEAKHYLAFRDAILQHHPKASGVMRTQDFTELFAQYQWFLQQEQSSKPFDATPKSEAFVQALCRYFSTQSHGVTPTKSLREITHEFFPQGDAYWQVKEMLNQFDGFMQTVNDKLSSSYNSRVTRSECAKRFVNDVLELKLNESQKESLACKISLLHRDRKGMKDFYRLYQESQAAYDITTYDVVYYLQDRVRTAWMMSATVGVLTLVNIMAGAQTWGMNLLEALWEKATFNTLAFHALETLLVGGVFFYGGLQVLKFTCFGKPSDGLHYEGNKLINEASRKRTQEQAFLEAPENAPIVMKPGQPVKLFASFSIPKAFNKLPTPQSMITDIVSKFEAPKTVTYHTATTIVDLPVRFRQRDDHKTLLTCSNQLRKEEALERLTQRVVYHAKLEDDSSGVIKEELELLYEGLKGIDPNNRYFLKRFKESVAGLNKKGVGKAEEIKNFEQGAQAIVATLLSKCDTNQKKVESISKEPVSFTSLHAARPTISKHMA